MVRWIDALSRTRGNIIGTINKAFSRSGPLDDACLEELEEALVGADVSVRLAAEWIEKLL